MKKYITMVIILLCMIVLLAGCGEKKTVTCDGCGKVVEVEAGSKMDDSWIVYCDTCYTEFYGEDGLVS